MKNTRRAYLIASVACFALAACAPQTRFVWGDYEGALYAYYKDPSQREVYRKSLIAAIDEGRKEDKVAPGLLAEVGYLDLEDGNTAEAVSLFREEMHRFPESTLFMTAMIQKAEAAKTSTKTGMPTS